MRLNTDLLSGLLEFGVGHFWTEEVDLPLHLALEVPCRPQWAQLSGDAVTIGAFSYLVSGFFHNVDIGRFCSVGEQVQMGRGPHPMSWASTSPLFYDEDYRAHLSANLFDFSSEVFVPFDSDPDTGRISVGHDVWIGHGAFIAPGVTLGIGSVIAAQAVVTHDVEPYEVVGGVPARHIRWRLESQVRSALLGSCWWEHSLELLARYGGKWSDPLSIVEACARADLSEVDSATSYQVVDMSEVDGVPVMRSKLESDLQVLTDQVVPSQVFLATEED